MKKTFLASIIPLLVFFIIGGGLAFAQFDDTGSADTGSDDTGSGYSGDGSPDGGPIIVNPFNCGGVTPCNIFTLLKAIIDRIILPIGGVLAVLAFIYSGFLYVTAQGNDTKLAKAHRALLYTVIGTAVLLGSWVIANVIENTINSLR